MSQQNDISRFRSMTDDCRRLVVFSAAGFPIMAKQNGARLVVINRDPTEMDRYADLVINTEIGATFEAALSDRSGL
ncbi:MAG: hypothetical protein HZB87_01520 [Desulfatitalea sp.]|nr:hypothetical protein [Desulfatitalea sp.]MBI5894897.1 hypothetical protein [Desulfobacterales bacterium]